METTTILVTLYAIVVTVALLDILVPSSRILKYFQDRTPARKLTPEELKIVVDILDAVPHAHNSRRIQFLCTPEPPQWLADESGILLKHIEYSKQEIAYKLLSRPPKR